MSTKFNMTADINGYNGYGIMPTYDMQSGLLAVGVAQSVVVPDNYPYWIAIFSYTPGANVWVSFDDTALAPTGAASSTSSSLNPAARRVKGGSTISIITADANIPMFGIEFQVVPPYQN